ncbi:sigma factor-like helix-turn-helix DNA-binding protein [Metasolibacillus meyeri]|uniref:Sigma factor-like helix-turn-helix DNA-binding protein n=1 Tax=Metasolibacillus meyeri TaxID=1071052 RepID=A0AAW9NS42_9BACL|nr:sigma factor-like helix-turn-helix DNA-binding protein [Metasolibacillus meyeri]MEC1180345.1 sigma factor-like helix-turn-helix DNA-binding protein [Metasolibacillus meyeri]
MAKYFPDLIEEYKQSLKNLQAVGGCTSMERDLKEAIQWMETGYDPAEYRAAIRKDCYVMDHYLMQQFLLSIDFTVPDMDEQQLNEEEERIDSIQLIVKEAMAGLTENERKVFVLIRGEYMTFSKVANILEITRSSVQSYLRRAELKIKNNIDGKKLLCHGSGYVMKNSF